MDSRLFCNSTRLQRRLQAMQNDATTARNSVGCDLRRRAENARRRRAALAAGLIDLQQQSTLNIVTAELREQLERSARVKRTRCEFWCATRHFSDEDFRCAFLHEPPRISEPRIDISGTDCYER